MAGQTHLRCRLLTTDFIIGLGDCRAVDTIFSPEDGTPFSQLPPSLREGRRRFWG